MSASCDMTIKFHGSDEEFERLMDKLFEIEGMTKRFESMPYWPFTVNGHTITAHNGGCHNIWGSYYLDPEVDLFFDLAQVVPNASFDVNSYRVYEGGGEGCETFVEVKYQDRRLEFKTQVSVDQRTLLELCTQMCTDVSSDDLTVVLSGKTKMFEEREELRDYLEEYGVEVKGTVNNKTDFVICNNSDSTAKTVKMAKDLGVPVVSEMQFIRMFCDAYDFDDEDQMKMLVSDLTYEELCEYYEVDETVTREQFDEMLKDPECYGVILYGSNNVSLVGPWETEVYVLGDDGEFMREETI